MCNLITGTVRLNLDKRTLNIIFNAKIRVMLFPAFPGNVLLFGITCERLGGFTKFSKQTCHKYSE